MQMTIGRVTEAAAVVRADTLRFYERQHRIGKPQRSFSGLSNLP